MVCILGVLKNKDGLTIKEEMLSWLTKYYDVFCVEQEPPGLEFEYPAIKCVLNTAITLNEPVLYLHTKGSGNKIPTNYKEFMMHSSVNYPKTAKPEDCQRVVRLMWKKEFTENKEKYINAVNTDKPVVACPFTGKDKMSWQNGWIINPAAAKELLKTFHKDKNRYYYEHMFRFVPTIDVKGIVDNTCDIQIPHHKTMWDKIWTYYE